MKQVLLLIAFCVASASLSAQDASPIIKRYLQDNQQKLKLSNEDVRDGWMISDQYVTKHNQVTHVYLQQQINGLKLYNAISSVAIKDESVVVFKSRFVPDAARRANTQPGIHQITPREAVIRAAEHVAVALTNLENGEAGTDKVFVFVASGSVREPIKVSQLYQNTEEEIRLAWNVEIQSKSDWWHIRVDAVTGEILDKGNYTVYCNFHSDAYQHHGEAVTHQPETCNESVPSSVATATYRVFPFPGESPNHTGRVLLSDPSDIVASPFGWHDTDGQPGAEYTLTVGNNVYAAEDRDDNNLPGHSAEGGQNLSFDFPYNPTQAPIIWEDAAITNLFYANNFMHDMTYHHGFDEAGGNFQENNYGNSGQQNDAVQADAQDGSGTDNANFSTPPDGNNGRMQMYIWTGAGTGSSGDSLRVNSPVGIQGIYYSPSANFGPELTAPITADIVLVVDDAAPENDGCQNIVNAAQLTGKIAVIDRGACNYLVKVQKAQDAGAIAVIVINNTSAGVFAMPGTSTTITIPSVMISLADGTIIRAQLANGPVNITLLPTIVPNTDRDSDLDNGIIAHEYGHGISNRLTGGPSNTGCLGNAEQMGEGWSDFYSLITTMNASDTRNTRRPIGTYALGQLTSGQGIRNKVYSTDMSINNYTYADLPGTGGAVHNIGELWATMLWDLTWNLIDLHGFEPNLMSSTGGNNMAQRLVTDGFKLQPCSPGFVDGRDAILEADRLNYNGAHQCLIWETFARRGLGYSANQGSSQNYNDGIVAFDLPPICQTAVEAPLAGFTVDHTSRCLGLATFQFTDQSQNLAQYWLWNFGDGTTSTVQNPTHTYAVEGAYTVTLVVTNNIASDTLVKANYVSVQALAPISANDITVCEGQVAVLTTTPGTQGNTAEWTDADGNVVHIGTTFNTPVLLQTTTFSVNEAENLPIQKVGPPTFGPGGNHDNNFVGQVVFTAIKSFTIKSVLVRAAGAANREIRLTNAAGDVIASKTVNVPDGDSRITLNFEIPTPGDYGLGAGPNVNLYRDNMGVNYPYTLGSVVTITGSSGGATRYYYFYDWEVQETPCRSAATDVTVTVTPGPVGAFTYAKSGLDVAFSNQSTGNPTTYLWNFGDGATSTLQNPSHTYATIGVYNVELTVSDGTCTTVFTQVVDFTTSTSALNQNRFDVQLSPNPATESANLTISGATGSRNVQIGLYSADGRLVQTQPFDTTQGAVVRLDLSGVAAGLYFVKVEAAAGLAIHKLVVQ